MGVWVDGLISGSIGGIRSNHLKFNKSWPNWDNPILFEDLMFPKTPTAKGGCMDQQASQWVGSGQMTNLVKFELIYIIWFCWKIPMGGWVG